MFGVGRNINGVSLLRKLWQFSSRAQSSSEVHELKLKINGRCIEQVSEVKYLCLILDSHLNFEKHVNMVSKVAKANLHTFRLIRDCLPYHAANSFVHSMIFSSS